MRAKYLAAAVFSIMFIFTFSGLTFAGESGNICSDATWGSKTIDADVYVGCEATLTINAGATLSFKDDADLMIGANKTGGGCSCQPDETRHQGTIDVNGGASNRVTFGSHDYGARLAEWGSLLLTSASTGNDVDNVTFTGGGHQDHYTVYGVQQAAFEIAGGVSSSTWFDNIVILDSGGDGIGCFNSDCDVAFRSSGTGNEAKFEIEGCANAGIRAGNNGTVTVSATGYIWDTELDGIIIQGNSTVELTGQLGGFDIYECGDNGGQSNRAGILVANGSLTVDSASAGTKYVEIKDNAYAGVYIQYAGSADITDASISGNDDYGIVAAAADLTLDDSEVRNHDEAGIYIDGSAADVTVTDSTIRDNDVTGIWMEDGELFMSYTQVYDNSDTGWTDASNDEWHAGIRVEGAASNNNTADCSCIYNNQGSSGDYQLDFVDFETTYGDFDATYSYWNDSTPETNNIYDYDDNSNFGDVDSDDDQATCAAALASTCN